MKRFLALLALCFSGLLYGIDDKPIINPVQDGNLTIKVNKAGTITDVLKVVGSTGRVGIGPSITAPDGTLHVMTSSAGAVTADADADDFTVESATNPGISLLGSGDDQLGIFFGNPGSSGQKDGGILYYQESYSTTANRRKIAMWAGGGGPAAAKLWFDGTNLGLGAEPGNMNLRSLNADLTIQNRGTSSASNKAGITFNSYTNAQAIYANADSVDSTIAGLFFTNSSGGTAMKIQADGKVGIGDTGPGQALTVKSAADSLQAFGIYDSRTQAAGVGASMALGGRHTDGSQGLTAFAQIAATKENSTSGNYRGSLIFSTNNGSGVNQRLAISPDGALFVRGAATSQNTEMEIYNTDAYVDVYSTRNSGTNKGYRFMINNTLAVGFKLDGSGYPFFPLMRSATGDAYLRFDNSTKEVYVQASSERYKTNIQSLKEGLPTLLSLRSVSFNPKEKPEKTNFGVIAEEAVKVLPEAVGVINGRIESFDYQQLHAFYIKAFQEQQAIIEKQKADISLMKKVLCESYNAPETLCSSK